MRFLLTADWHLTDRPKDEYRFGIFDAVRDAADQYKVDTIFVIGDITDAKDKHPARLVNRIVDGFRKLAQSTDREVYIIMGNHDYTNPENPFFKFLANIKDVHFVVKPRELERRNVKFLLLPHTRDDSAWLGYVDKWAGVADYALIHQCVEGVESENGTRLSGLSTVPLTALKTTIYAGDIHKPQTVGPVTYVGSPYNIRFGDDFTPRMLVFDGKKMHTVHTDFPRKHVLNVRSIDELTKAIEETHEGDHVKIVITLSREELVEWPTYKARAIKLCEDTGLKVFGCKLAAKKQTKRVRLDDPKPIERATPQEVLAKFCVAEKVPSEYKEVGMQILGD